MARRYGQTGLSSLLSSAKSAREKQLSLEDQIKAYEWDLSAKTAQDTEAYTKYLRNRANAVKTADPSKYITLQGKLGTVQTAFTTAEIRRAQLAINYGAATDQQKYEKITQLYRMALESGDMDLASRLEMQASTLDMKIQNARASAAASGATKAYTAYKKGFDDELKQADTAIKDIEQAYKLGEISKNDYVYKSTAAYDAKKRALDTALTNGQNLKEEDYAKFQESMDKLQTGAGREFLGRAGQILRYRPDLKQVGFDAQGNPTVKDGPIMGYDRVVVGDKKAAEVGVDGSIVGQVYTGNPDIGGGIKKLGISGIKDGKTRTVNPLTDEVGEYQVFVDDPNNPQLAYTKDARGIFYLVNKDGTITPAKDVNQKDTGTVQFAPEDIANYRKENDMPDVGSPGDTARNRGMGAATGQLAGGFGKRLFDMSVPGMLLGAQNAVSNLVGRADFLRQKAEAKKAAEIAEGKRMYQEQLAAKQAIEAANAARNAKIAQTPAAKRNYWSPAPYRDQPLIAKPKNQAEQAYNIGSQVGLKLPRL